MLGNGLQALLGGGEFDRLQKLEFALDVIPIAYDLTSEQFDRLLGAPHGWTESYRSNPSDPPHQILLGVDRLLRFHGVLRRIVPPQDYPKWLNRPWPENSHIGGRSPLEVMLELGHRGIALVEAACRCPR